MHTPVLLKEVVEILNPKPNENFIDATIGGGGHSLAILEKTAPKGKILGVDWNKKAIDSLKLKIQKDNLTNRLILVRDNFTNLKDIVEKLNFGPINGIIFDLGISSDELENSGRGFSFLKDELLVMKYGDIRAGGLSAAEVVNSLSKEELEKIFWEYGEERHARKIAAKIVEERKVRRILTTGDLVEVIIKALPYRDGHGRRHFATKAFQALRIFVNDELNNLKMALISAESLLAESGRIAVISFHSLEDRIVKNYFREMENLNKLKILTKKPIIPSQEEIKINPRSRSAKLRAAQKVFYLL